MCVVVVVVVVVVVALVSLRGGLNRDARIA